MNELKTEYTTLVSMDAIFFGPKTCAVIEAMDAKRGAWFERKEDEWRLLFSAMHSEWSYGLEGVTTIQDTQRKPD
jgi:hypothetical protein